MVIMIVYVRVVGVFMFVDWMYGNGRCGCRFFVEVKGWEGDCD